jgi:hypothetical protein
MNERYEEMLRSFPHCVDNLQMPTDERGLIKTARALLSKLRANKSNPRRNHISALERWLKIFSESSRACI